MRVHRFRACSEESRKSSRLYRRSPNMTAGWVSGLHHACEYSSTLSLFARCTSFRRGQAISEGRNRSVSLEFRPSGQSALSAQPGQLGRIRGSTKWRRWRGSRKRAHPPAGAVCQICGSSSAGIPHAWHKGLHIAPELPINFELAFRAHPRDYLSSRSTIDSDNSADLGFPRARPRNTPKQRSGSLSSHVLDRL